VASRPTVPRLKVKAATNQVESGAKRIPDGVKIFFTNLFSH
jgi:hypothetical protein